jgi:L-ascorbate metabolism protein UlaG (beta-lactamase superfamily)
MWFATGKEGIVMALNSDVQLTYLGHATFLVRSASGKNLLIDPWVMGNPTCPEALKNLDRVDIMLVTHGHFDHIADAVAIGQQHTPKVIGIYETCHWLGKKGVENALPMNKGGSQQVEGITITMVHADHSCGILDDDGSIIYGGEAVGYVIEFENGFRIYHAGDTNVFGDMRIIGELYRPEVALLPIGDLYTMSPREAAYAIRLLGVKKVIPMHYATFPPLVGTPDQLRELTQDITGLEVIAAKPGETV